MKQELCKEFCDQISVRSVPAGLAIGTSYVGLSGDPIGFYVVGPDDDGSFRVEDSGDTVPILEACGADVGLEARAAVFRELLSQYEVEFDETRGELKTRALSESEVPKAALRFVALLLRLQDLTFLARERAESTFRQEALRDLVREIGNRATISENEILSDLLSDFPVDAVIRSAGRIPVAVFFVRDPVRMYQAMLFEAEAEWKAKIECRVVALMENTHSVSKKVLEQAMNRVMPLLYRGEEKTAIGRIAREALGTSSALN